MGICLFLNLIFLVLLAWELNNDYAELEVKGLSVSVKRNYIARIVLACVLTCIALFLLYRVFGVDGNNLNQYIKYGKVE